MNGEPDLLALWQAGVAAVRGDHAVAADLASHSLAKPDHVIAVGKAAAAMAAPVMSRWPDVPCLIVTKYGHATDVPAAAQVIEAAHPVPDDNSLAAGAALMDAVATSNPQDHLLMLVSGGASALAEAPTGDLSLSDIQAKTRHLLATGATIADMNALRCELSSIKCGKLLARFGGRNVTTLALSDVEGDALGTIGSGIGAAPANARFAFVSRIVGSNAIARAAVARASSAPVRSNAETLYDDVSVLAPKIAVHLSDAKPGVHILGGETVVNLPPDPGRGGRNMALALELAREISGQSGLRILVAGTDGTDGPTDAAGAIVDGETWDASGTAALAAADAYPWLDARGALLKTGPTGTNVMDLLIAYKA